MSESGTSDIEALRVTHEESRAVLDHQIALQKDLDDKAIRTVRLALVLIAFVVSVAQLMGPDRVTPQEIGVLLSVVAGTFGLSLAVFIGLGVYVETDVPFGIGPGHREEVTPLVYSEREWLEVLLAEYDEWTDDAIVSNDLNAAWLGRAQASMAIGVGYLLVSILALTTPISAEVAFLGSTLLGGTSIVLYYLTTGEGR